MNDDSVKALFSKEMREKTCSLGKMGMELAVGAKMLFLKKQTKNLAAKLICSKGAINVKKIMARAAATYPQNKEASNGQEKCARRSNYKVSNDLSSAIIFLRIFCPRQWLFDDSNWSDERRGRSMRWSGWRERCLIPIKGEMRKKRATKQGRRREKQLMKKAVQIWLLLLTVLVSIWLLSSCCAADGGWCESNANAKMRKQRTTTKHQAASLF